MYVIRAKSCVSAEQFLVLFGLLHSLASGTSYLSQNTRPSLVKPRGLPACDWLNLSSLSLPLTSALIMTSELSADRTFNPQEMGERSVLCHKVSKKCKPLTNASPFMSTVEAVE